MIVQELQQIQERCGYLPEDEMRGLSDRTRIPLHRLHEVASYYPLYRLKPPPAVDVKVCRDMSCHLRGAPRLQQDLEALGRELGDVEVGGVSCLGQCDRAIAVSMNDHYIFRGLSDEELKNRIRTAHAKSPMPHQHTDNGPLGWKIDLYNGQPRWEALKGFLANRDVPGLLKKLEVANLRGMGGAGFPTFRKWSAVRSAPGSTKYLVCNADESEPGTFKDRELMRRTPYLLIEGMALAALVIGATQAWIYVRHEYVDEIAVLQQALQEARAQGIIGKNVLGSGIEFDLELFISPGGYVQGEESALLEAMEDRRGEPRNKPPFPVFNGLYNKPTVINNVETLCWAPAIAIRGGEWYRDSGVNGEPGLRFVSVSGDVQKPGVYEVPFGQPMRELVHDLAGGPPPGRKFKAFATSGPSGGFLPLEIPVALLPKKFVEAKVKAGTTSYSVLDVPLGLNTFGMMGGMLGAAFVAYDDSRDMVEQALNCVAFYRNESCGKCVPCRTGSQKLVDIISEMLVKKNTRRATLDLINELGETMSIASICGLGQVASNPMTSVLKFFPDDVKKYLAANGRQA